MFGRVKPFSKVSYMFTLNNACAEGLGRNFFCKMYGLAANLICNARRCRNSTDSMREVHLTQGQCVILTLAQCVGSDRASARNESEEVEIGEMPYARRLPATKS